MSEDYDYEIIVGMVTTILPDGVSYISKEKRETKVLPSDIINPYWSELSGALNKAGIPDKTCHFETICCKEADYLFGKIRNIRELIDCIRHCKEDFPSRSHIFYCPFCGKRLKFVWKNLVTFRLGREKKEVCAYAFEKVE